ncbi:MAG: hypothetical protein RSH79_09090 [Clostridiales bacterium]
MSLLGMGEFGWVWVSFCVGLGVVDAMSLWWRELLRGFGCG